MKNPHLDLIREQFTRTIESMAASDLARLGKGATLPELLQICVEHEVDVIPICDDGGRIMGLVSADELLRAWGDAFQRSEGRDG